MAEQRSPVRSICFHAINVLVLKVIKTMWKFSDQNSFVYTMKNVSMPGDLADVFRQNNNTARNLCMTVPSPVFLLSK